jgi:hypothetical protein
VFEPESDEFTVNVTDKTGDAKAMLEVGFEYVCQKDNLIFLRKRKRARASAKKQSKSPKKWPG